MAGEDAAQASPPGTTRRFRLRELVTTVHRMNCERYVGDSKLHEMVEIAMEESWRYACPICSGLPRPRRCHCDAPRFGRIDAPDVPLAAMCAAPR